MEELYRQAILAHYQRPTNRRVLESPSAQGFTQDPLCGDEMSVAVLVENGRIADAAFDARGCSISHASADMMADLIRGKSLGEAAELIRRFEEMMLDPGVGQKPELGELQVLQGVRKYPVRIKCALLPWNTLRQALEVYGAGSRTPSTAV